MTTTFKPLLPVDRRVVRRLLKLRGMSQSAAARRARVNKQTLHYIVTGRNHSVREDVRRRLAKVLAVEPEVLSGASPLNDRELDVHYDPLTDVLTVEGMNYSGDLMRYWGQYGLPEGACFQITKREDGVIWLVEIPNENGELSPPRVLPEST